MVDESRGSKGQSPETGQQLIADGVTWACNCFWKKLALTSSSVLKVVLLLKHVSGCCLNLLVKAEPLCLSSVLYHHYFTVNEQKYELRHSCLKWASADVFVADFFPMTHTEWQCELPCPCLWIMVLNDVNIKMLMKKTGVDILLPPPPFFFWDALCMSYIQSNLNRWKKKTVFHP